MQKNNFYTSYDNIFTYLRHKSNYKEARKPGDNLINALDGFNLLTQDRQVVH